jgi:YggT family protein
MSVIAALIDLYSLVVMLTVIMSWLPIGRRNPLAMLLYRLTEPVLEPIRRALPPMGGLDLSPMVLFIALLFLKRLIGH